MKKVMVDWAKSYVEEAVKSMKAGEWVVSLS
jgi:hypothetical protein